MEGYLHWPQPSLARMPPYLYGSFLLVRRLNYSPWDSAMQTDILPLPPNTRESRQ